MTGANVFQIGSGWFPEFKGGAENMFYNISRGFDDQEFRIRGVVPGSSDVAVATRGRMKAFDAKGQSIIQRALAVRRLSLSTFKQARPDLIASHFALYTLPLLDQLSRSPFVVHFHGPWALESKVEGAGKLTVASKRAMERLVYRRAQRVIVLSQAFGQILETQYGIDPSIIRLIPGGVDCAHFETGLSREEARRALGWETDRPVIVVVRRLVRRMGLDRLIEAMAVLREGGGPGARDVVLHVIGKGPDRALLEEQAAALGLGDAIRFEGFVPDALLPTAYRAADMTLIPSMELEGFGLTVIESLAAGTPVLLTPVGGLPEVVADLSSHMILEGTDAASIAHGIAAVLADPALLPDAESCKAYAKQNFDWSVILPQIADVYHGVV